MTPEEALQQQVRELSERLQRIEARLDAEEQQRRGLMRDTRRCPSCQNTKILHAEQMISELHGEASYLASGGFLGYKGLGKVQLFVCVACGFGEVQVVSPAELEGKKGVRVLKASEGEGPYR
jgi:hypothetical protein